tara:strand:- start:41 stop:595 length:555 start_codon:yes stop_codon:yes gene_type:complete
MAEPDYNVDFATGKDELYWENRKEDFLANLITREGGWVVDQGGKTKYGISERGHKGVDIANIGIEGAKKIYRTEYLHRGEKRLGKTHEAIKFMDMEVNMGYENAMKVTQRALNSLLSTKDQITADSSYGDLTKEAIKKVQDNYSSQDIINAMKTAQLSYYQSLPDFHKTGGWKTRATYDPIKEN